MTAALLAGSAYNDIFRLEINGQNKALLTVCPTLPSVRRAARASLPDPTQDGKTVTINNLVPAGEPGKANPALDNKDYVPNPDGQAFGYTGYTKVLTCVGVTKVRLPRPNHDDDDENDVAWHHVTRVVYKQF